MRADFCLHRPGATDTALLYEIRARIDSTPYAVITGPREVDGDLLIPSTVVFEGEEYPVLEIDSLPRPSKPTQVRIPDTISSIKPGAFHGLRRGSEVSFALHCEIPQLPNFINCDICSLRVPDSVTEIVSFWAASQSMRLFSDETHP
jgi:hypothetical protein